MLMHFANQLRSYVPYLQMTSGTLGCAHVLRVGPRSVVVEIVEVQRGDLAGLLLEWVVHRAKGFPLQAFLVDFLDLPKAVMVKRLDHAVLRHLVSLNLLV
jgi:hypothetical protein